MTVCASETPAPLKHNPANNTEENDFAVGNNFMADPVS
jgi:cytochrome c1